MLRANARARELCLFCLENSLPRTVTPLVLIGILEGTTRVPTTALLDQFLAQILASDHHPQTTTTNAVFGQIVSRLFLCAHTLISAAQPKWKKLRWRARRERTVGHGDCAPFASKVACLSRLHTLSFSWVVEGRRYAVRRPRLELHQATTPTRPHNQPTIQPHNLNHNGTNDKQRGEKQNRSRNQPISLPYNPNHNRINDKRRGAKENRSR